MPELPPSTTIRRFHAQVAPLLAGMEEAAAQARGAAHAVQGRLRVNVDPWIARLVLAPHLSAFLAAHPLLSLELLVRDSLGDLVSEGVDVAVRFGEPEPSSLIARKLLETPILACAAPAYLARHGRPRHRATLRSTMFALEPVTARPSVGSIARKVVRKVSGADPNDLAISSPPGGGHGIAQTIEFGLVCSQVASLSRSWRTGRRSAAHSRIHPSRHRRRKARRTFCLPANAEAGFGKSDPDRLKGRRKRGSHLRGNFDQCA
jgi:hypothetical protein